MRKNLSVLTTHPIQYQAPIWRRLAQEPDIDLQVYFGSDFSVRGYRDEGFGVEFSWDVPLTEGYPFAFLSSDPKVQSVSSLSFDARDFRRRLLLDRPDFALLNGYTPYAFYVKALLVLRSLSIPILLRMEATDEARRRNDFKELVRRFALGLLYSQVHTCFAIGYNARLHYLSKRVPASKIRWSPYCVDTELFEKQVEYWGAKRSEVRRNLGFQEEDTVFVFSGKLTSVKDPLILADSLRQFVESNSVPIGLLVVGDGLLKKEFEDRMSAISQVKTAFVGFQNQSQMGKYYSAADCLVLPSIANETWGLVVNEALMFGVPAIVSDRVGCRHDLIVEGQTGFVFPAGDASALTAHMYRIVEILRADRPVLRSACQRLVSKYSVEEAVCGIRQVVTGA